jgi:trehalose synthase
VAIEGTPDFFAVTKRIHNRLYGAVGDGGALDGAARAVAFVFSRESFACEGLDRDRIAVSPPSIDVFSPKHPDLERTTVLAVRRACGVLFETDEAGSSMFKRQDGTPSRVNRQVELFVSGPVNAPTPVVLQGSHWDALKDPLGVIRAFAERVPPSTGEHLVYAGSAVSAVADDPEGARVLADALALRESLPAEPRSRVQLAFLPIDDPADNAIVVNALQRHAAVITQKSLADPERAGRIGERARERVRDELTSPWSLLDSLRLIQNVLERSRVSAAA